MLDKRSTASYNKQAALREAVSRALKIEQYRMLEWKPLKVLEKDHKQFQKVIQGRKRLRAERTRFNTLKVINIIYKEVDPGSGRTLAARLTHASRTEIIW